MSGITFKGLHKLGPHRYTSKPGQPYSAAEYSKNKNGTSSKQSSTYTKTKPVETSNWGVLNFGQWSGGNYKIQNKKKNIKSNKAYSKYRKNKTKKNKKN